MRTRCPQRVVRPDDRGPSRGIRSPGTRRRRVDGRGSSETGGNLEGFAHPPGRHLPLWGTVRLRMTLWNVAVLALILGAMGGVVRYKVQADLFATVDRTLAERAHEFGRRYAAGPPNAGRNTRARPRLLDPMTATAEGTSLGGSIPRALPPLEPRVIPRDRAGREHWDQPWDRNSYVRSLEGRTVYST